jgi:hypothetical protein
VERTRHRRVSTDGGGSFKKRCGPRTLPHVQKDKVLVPYPFLPHTASNGSAVLCRPGLQTSSRGANGRDEYQGVEYIRRRGAARRALVCAVSRSPPPMAGGH